MHPFDLLDVVPQAQAAITMSVDPGKMIIGGVLAIIATMGAMLKILGSRVLASIDAVGAKVDATDLKVASTQKQVTKIDQELFGPDGTNGMRSDVKRISRQMEADRTVLIELAVKNDIDVPERVR